MKLWSQAPSLPKQSSSSKTLAVTQSPSLIMESRTLPLPFSSSLFARSLSVSVSLEATTGPTRPTGGVLRRPKLRASLEALSVSVL